VCPWFLGITAVVEKGRSEERKQPKGKKGKPSLKGGKNRGGKLVNCVRKRIEKKSASGVIAIASSMETCNRREGRRFHS